MIIREFTESSIKEVYKNTHNVVKNTDFRCVNYENENKTLENKIANELSIFLYPICSNLSLLINSNFFINNFSDYDYWFISPTILQCFS